MLIAKQRFVTAVVKEKEAMKTREHTSQRQAILIWTLLLILLGQGSSSVLAWDGDLTYGGAAYVGSIWDPVTTSIGEYAFSKPLLNNLEFRLDYASRLEKWVGGFNDPFGGVDFTHNFHIAMNRDPENIRVLFPQGNSLLFARDGDAWRITVEEVMYQLTETDDYCYLMDPIQEQVYTFEKTTAMWGSDVGVLIRIEDRNGNALTFSHDRDEAYIYPTRVEDGLGRFLEFSYEDPTPTWRYPHLVKVTGPGDRSVHFDYELFLDDWAVRLASVTDAAGDTTRFTYTDSVVNGKVTQQILPEGNAPYTQTYESVPMPWGEETWWPRRVVAQTDTNGNVMQLSFDDDTGLTTLTDPLGVVSQHRHEKQRLLTERIDASGLSATMTYDDEGRRVSVTDRLGDTTTLRHHALTGALQSITDAAGNKTSTSYTAQVQSFANPLNGETVSFTFYDLTRIDFPDESYAQMTYDPQGNRLAYTDPLGHTTSYTYDQRGQVLTQTNPLKGEVTYTYHADGSLATYTESDVGTTRYGYDVYKRLTDITRPDGSTVHLAYDLNDRLVSLTDELDQTTSFAYDRNGNRIASTNALDQTSTFGYDLMDRVTEVTDAQDQTSAMTYDAHGRIATYTDSQGQTFGYTYDARGRLTAVTDPQGNPWTTDYDDEGVPQALTTPEGRTTTFQTDTLGRTTHVTDPLEATTQFAYDAGGRIIGALDPLGRLSTWSYDSRGKLTEAAVPGLGSATYGYNELGLLTQITDLQDASWQFEYSPMGRPTSHTDPLGRVQEFTYDDRGRLQETVHADGASSDVTYDARGLVTRVEHADGPVLDYAYDEAGRLVRANHLTLTYDERGNIIETRDDDGAVFAATYRPDRQLRTVTYGDHATVSYRYNELGLLTDTEDDLSGTRITFGYDRDGRLTNIIRSNGVNTTFTHDATGRVTGSQDGDLARQQYRLNAAGEVIQAQLDTPLSQRTFSYAYDPAGRLVSRTDGSGETISYTYDKSGNLLNRTDSSSSETHTYDEAGQLTDPGTAFNARGSQTRGPGKTCTYDGANRISRIVTETDMVTYTYNGLGSLRTRTENSTTTTFYHNYALGLLQRVAEARGGTYQRLYVYTPLGSLLYSMDPTGADVRFYHYDRQGSTFCLTDENGTVLDQYEYDPHGRVTHQGDSDQTYIYLGRLGVSSEPVGQLYRVGARTYDPKIARFLNRGGICPVLGDPAGLNPHLYLHRDPNPADLVYDFADLEPEDWGTDRWPGEHEYLDLQKRVLNLSDQERKRYWELARRIPLWYVEEGQRESRAAFERERWGPAGPPGPKIVPEVDYDEIGRVGHVPYFEREALRNEERARRARLEGNRGLAENYEYRADYFRGEVIFWKHVYADKSSALSRATFEPITYDLEVRLQSGEDYYPFRYATSRGTIQTLPSRRENPKDVLYWPWWDITQGTATRPGLEASSDELEFGEIVVGSSADQVVTIANTGSETLELGPETTVTGSDDFSVARNWTVLQPGAEGSMTVTFTPETQGEHTAQIVIGHKRRGAAKPMGFIGIIARANGLAPPQGP